MNIKTEPTKLKDITRAWHLVDVNNEVLGRACTKIALLLMGKAKPYFAKNMDCGDYVVVVNARNVKVSGQKENKKLYRRHSGYPGGYKETPLLKLRHTKPTEIVRFAVLGMLPDNKLKARLMTRLHIFPDAKHDYETKFKAG